MDNPAWAVLGDVRNPARAFDHGDPGRARFLASIRALALNHLMARVDPRAWLECGFDRPLDRLRAKAKSGFLRMPSSRDREQWLGPIRGHFRWSEAQERARNLFADIAYGLHDGGNAAIAVSALARSSRAMNPAIEVQMFGLAEDLALSIARMTVAEDRGLATAVLGCAWSYAAVGGPVDVSGVEVLADEAEEAGDRVRAATLRHAARYLAEDYGPRPSLPGLLAGEII